MNKTGLRFYPEQMFLRRMYDDYMIYSTGFDDPVDDKKFDRILMGVSGRVLRDNLNSLLHFIDSLDPEVIEIKEKESENSSVSLKFIAGDSQSSPYFTICFQNRLVVPELSLLPEFYKPAEFEIE